MKIRTTYDNKINQVPVLWAQVHPGGLEFVLELKHGVSDTKRKLWADFGQTKTIVVAFTYTMSPDDSLPYVVISANLRIEIAE